MRRPRWIAAALILGFASMIRAEPTVVLLSWDGLRHDAPDLTPTPALARLERDGARAERLVPVFPSNTFPGHVSLATGTHPDRHGILDNNFYDRERGEFRMSNDASWIDAEPLWVTAERQGVKTASYFWVGSETDWNGVGAHYRIAPFNSDIDEETKVDQILAWLDLPDDERPRLILSWWHGADRAGHRNGPDAAAVGSAIEGQSRALLRLLEGLDARNRWDQTTLLLVSDHGMTRLAGTIAIEATLQNIRPAVRIEAGSSVAHLFLDDATDQSEVERHLAKLEHMRVYAAGSLPPDLRLQHPARTGDLVALADPGYVFRQASLTTRVLTTIASWFGQEFGIHGYAPDHPDMGGVFFALGRGVKPGTKLPAVRMIDVAPTAAALLGISPPRDAEGGALELSPRTR